MDRAPIVWWHRWQMFEQARAARAVWNKALGQQTPDEQALTAWAATNGKY